MAGSAMKSRPSYSELVNLIKTKKEVWVTLYDGLFICLTNTDPNNKDGFLAKFIPCAKNSRVYNIPYNKIKELRKGKYNEC